MMGLLDEDLTVLGPTMALHCVHNRIVLVIAKVDPLIATPGEDDHQTNQLPSGAPNVEVVNTR